MARKNSEADPVDWGYSRAKGAHQQSHAN